MCHTKSLLYGMVKTVAMTTTMTNANRSVSVSAGKQLCALLSESSKDVPKCAIADLCIL